MLASWQRVQAGDEAALEEIFNRHAIEVLSILKQRMSSERARDLVAAVFSQAWERRHAANFDDDEELVAWLKRIAEKMRRRERLTVFWREGSLAARAWDRLRTPLGKVRTIAKTKLTRWKALAATAIAHSRQQISAFFTMQPKPSSEVRTDDAKRVEFSSVSKHIVKLDAEAKTVRDSEDHHWAGLCHGARRRPKSLRDRRPATIARPAHDLARAASWVNAAILMACLGVLSIATGISPSFSTNGIGIGLAMLVLACVIAGCLLAMLVSALRPRSLSTLPPREVP